MTQYVCLFIETGDEEDNYIKASARIRHISKKELYRRVMTTVVKEQMFGAILDDVKWEDE